MRLKELIKESNRSNGLSQHLSLFNETKEKPNARSRITAFVQKCVAVLIFLIPFLALCTGIYAVMAYSTLLIKTLMWTGIAIITLLIYTKTLRKRITFYSKLKRMCKKNGYRLTLQRSLLKSLKWSPDKCDFVLETPRQIYYVHLLAAPKYLHKLFFESPSRIHLIYFPPKKGFYIIFDFKLKSKTFEIDFSDVPDIKSKEVVKTIIANPVCIEMLYKTPESTLELTGNGGNHHGYTVFAGTGFINYVQRHDEETAE